MLQEAHFLQRLSRADSRQTELALTLYNDSEAIDFLLARAAIPEGAERIALSLAPGDQGPFALVQRPQGRFVTCLGAGMKHGCPQIEHVRLMAELDRLAELRGRRTIAEQLAGGTQTEALKARLRKRGPHFDRQEFLALSSLTPAVRPLLLYAFAQVCNAAIELRASLLQSNKRVQRQRVFRRPLRLYWEYLWFQGNLLPLVFEEGSAGLHQPARELLERDHDTRVFFQEAMFMSNDRVLALRASWATASLGDMMVDSFTRIFREAQQSHEALYSYCALLALALRHPHLRARIGGLLRAVDFYPAPMADLLQRAGRKLAPSFLLPYTDPARADAAFTSAARRCLFGALDAHPHLPRYASPEAIPADLARAYSINCSAPILDSPQAQVELCLATPFVACAKAEDLFAPPELATAQSDYSEQAARELLERQRPLWYQPPDPPPEPVKRTAAKTGRNDPCPCGSGKKYKRCCEPRSIDEARLEHFLRQ